jgi:hypothetical protein
LRAVLTLVPTSHDVRVAQVAAGGLHSAIVDGTHDTDAHQGAGLTFVCTVHGMILLFSIFH